MRIAPLPEPESHKKVRAESRRKSRERWVNLSDEEKQAEANESLVRVRKVLLSISGRVGS